MAPLKNLKLKANWLCPRARWLAIAAALVLCLQTSYAMVPPPWSASTAAFSGCSERTLTASGVAGAIESSHATISSDGHYFAYRVSDTLVRLASRSASDEGRNLSVTAGNALGIRFLKGAHQLALLDGNKLQLIESETGGVTKSFSLGSDLVYRHTPVKHVEFSENGFFVVLLSTDHYLRLYETTSGKELGSYVDTRRLNGKVAVANNGKQLLLSHGDGQIHGLSLSESEGGLKPEWKLNVEEGPLGSLEFSPNPAQGWVCVTESGVLWSSYQFQPQKNQFDWTNRAKLNFGIAGNIRRARFLGAQTGRLLIAFDRPDHPNRERLFALNREGLAMTHEFSLPWDVPLRALSSDEMGIYALGDGGAYASYSVAPVR